MWVGHVAQIGTKSSYATSVETLPGKRLDARIILQFVSDK
jgi:hypothetical protein